MENLNELKEKIFTEINAVNDIFGLEEIRVKYLGRKGSLTAILKSLSQMSIEDRVRIGKEANLLRSELESVLRLKKEEFSRLEFLKSDQKRRVDITAPGKKIISGSSHPLSRIRKSAEEIFSSLGFEIAEGPEVESEYYNFDALNIPFDHPAREMHDTFWLSPDKFSSAKGDRFLMRTHTSPVQIRYMQTHIPPFRIIAPGRVFRHEATDVSHEIQFNQLEGLMIGKEVSLADLKGILEQFLKRLLGDKIEIRFRPSYFPFVEPGVEVDMLWKKKWLELLGAGMVHPNVLKAGGIDSKEWQGFAFGVGLDRLAMLKYGIDDVRLFYSGDLRFLNQF